MTSTIYCKYCKKFVAYENSIQHFEGKEWFNYRFRKCYNRSEYNTHIQNIKKYNDKITFHKKWAKFLKLNQ
jgi:hypothetical protein